MQSAFELAVHHHQAGRLIEARTICRQLLAANPADANVLHLLGMVENQLGELEIAAGVLERARRQRPADPYLLNTLGSTYGKQGRHKDAEKCLRRALSLRPDLAEAHSNLGSALTGLGQLREAERSLRRALALDSGSVNASINLGVVLRKLGNPEEAEKCYREVISREPDLALAHSNLGNVLGDLGRQAEAEQCYRRALAITPDLAEAQFELGNALMRMGKVEEAEQRYRNALALKPALHDAHSALLFVLNAVPGRHPADIYAEHRAFAERFYRPAGAPPHRNSPDPGRRLRIGYVSGDLRDHPVGQFIAPVLARHQHSRFEITCYYNHRISDGMTARLKGYADRWREVLHVDDGALAELIRRDGIDILVDLSGHTGGTRLHVFAHKPAPVQVTWLGYLNTTGMQEMDYRITDAHASPEGMLDDCHSERLVRLPDSQWCFEAPPDCPQVTGPPSVDAGYVTFASFSNLARIGPPVVELWSRLLARVPDSRLLIVRRGLASIRDEYRARFARHGVAPERIDLRDGLPFGEYLALYGATDVVLDTFPYTGGTTTCHALWMGVPVVTLTGPTATSRGGASLLNAVGLGELVAGTPDQYLDIAAALAQDRSRLAALRAGMRDRVAASPLMDAERFTRNLEEAYRTMWRSWCESGTRSPVSEGAFPSA